MKNEREITEGMLWERKEKIKSKKEKTLQQHKGLPTLSVALNYIFVVYIGPIMQ